MAAVTVQVVLSPADYTKYMAGLKERYMPTVLRGITAGAAKCIPFLHKRTENAPPASPRGKTGAIDTGHYKAAWRSEAVKDGARVYNQRPYASVIETGRRPWPVGEQGIKNITRWVKNKLGYEQAEAEGVAFAIAKTLAKRPLWAREVMTGDPEGLLEIVMDELMHELELEMTRVP